MGNEMSGECLTPDCEGTRHMVRESIRDEFGFYRGVVAHCMTCERTHEYLL